ncbi:hypothetical protein K435DRAFT_858367 [Dendrothele bispora CBS 962.96]|uniref:Uncharacterized protein n=1 Tax=Dendrothele bispora (strain CBS 962.96) TaxID=1314807 RepID=A0A4S8M370_DENBC|nr:hypothetical protein K435DRAFT_858367 [Dendrothele bispora CBS 962.96]
MFKVVHSLLVAAALLIAVNSAFTLASPAYEKRTDATCPYPYSIRSTLVSRQSSGLSFTGAQWIWTNEIGANDALLSTVTFSVDNSAILFVNGEKIAHEGNWFAAGTYCVPLKPCTNVIALNATNETPIHLSTILAWATATFESLTLEGVTVLFPSRVLKLSLSHLPGPSGVRMPPMEEDRLDPRFKRFEEVGVPKICTKPLVSLTHQYRDAH